MKQSEKNRLVDTDVTLDGKRARIVGRLNEFATVTDYDRHFDWAWDTVKNIVDNKQGKFKS